MSSPRHFLNSSQASPSSSIRRRARSKFTYRHLTQLSQYSTSCPLRVIAHIDLDAFYAQCEVVRLGLPPEQPLAVQQWQGLIAINYAARAFGLSRHVTCQEAKKACPHIILQHVATWKEGDDKWRYRSNAAAGIQVQKVSLDPYRLESRRILAVIKDWLPKDLQRVEKASIDEVFLDLSAHVHSILLERHAALRPPAPYDDVTEALPRPPSTVIDWATDALVDLDAGQTENDDPDWDDVVMGIASEIVRGVRKEVFEKLKYTCSAGVAKNKMLAKLGSAHKKPNQQTIVRNRAVQQFMSDFKFTKIRNLGGKLGDDVVAAFNTEMVSDLLEVPVERLRKQLGDDTGNWLYAVIRGEDTSEVNPRTDIKSMLSAKSFRPSINDFETGCKWLRIFAADIYARMVDLGVFEQKRRPKTITLHHRQGGQTRSKSAPIPPGKNADENILFELAKNLLAQVVVDGRAWPCANLSLNVGGFDEGLKDNKGIGGFLVRGEEAKALNQAVKVVPERGGSETPPPGKRRKVEDGGIRAFLGNKREHSGQSNDNDDDDEHDFKHDTDEEARNFGGDEADDFLPPRSGQAAVAKDGDLGASGEGGDAESHETKTAVAPAARYTCQKCQKLVLIDQQNEHEDWHFARELQREESAIMAPPAAPRPNLAGTAQSSHAAKPKAVSRGRPLKDAPKAGKGQTKLAFG